MEAAMNLDGIWKLEESLWTGGEERYRALVGEECLMVVPTPPFLLAGGAAIEAVSDTPRWSNADLSERKSSQPGEDCIVIAYHVRAEGDGGKSYEANCTSTYHRTDEQRWHVVQHQQTPRATVG
jgi:hypothetical protein